MNLSNSFTNHSEDRSEDLVLLWEAIKDNVENIDISQNSLPKSFYNYVQKDLKDNPKTDIKINLDDPTIDWQRPKKPLGAKLPR